MTIQLEQHHRDLLRHLQAISDQGEEIKARMEASIAIARGELAKTLLQGHLMTVLQDAGIPLVGKADLNADCSQVTIPDPPRPPQPAPEA